eukprot:scaffold4229_cov30-Tisochrysis_lutea.AAC.3
MWPPTHRALPVWVAGTGLRHAHAPGGPRGERWPRPGRTLPQPARPLVERAPTPPPWQASHRPPHSVRREGDARRETRAATR